MEQEDESTTELFLNKIKENESLDEIARFVGKDFLLQFLRGKKNDWKKAYKTFLGYVEIRRGKYIDFYKSIRPSRSEELFKTGIMQVLNQRDSQGRAVVLATTKHWNADLVEIDECLKLLILLGDLLIRDESTHEIHFIFDLADFTKEHFMAITPSFVFKLIQLFWSNLPLRYAGIHLINEAPLFGMMIKGIKPFFPKKLRNRLEIHGTDLTSLHKCISPDILPVSLGGKLSEEKAFDVNFQNKILEDEDFYTNFAELL